MHDGGMPEVSVDHGPSRRLSWTSVQLSDVIGPPPPVSGADCGGLAVPVTPPEPAPVASTSAPVAASLATSPPEPPPDVQPDPSTDTPTDPPTDPRTDPRTDHPTDPRTGRPSVPPPAPPSQTAVDDALAAQLRADSDDREEVTVLGVALVANCHVSLVIFGLFFLAAGSLLCVIAFRAPTSAEGDMQSRVAGTFFLCLAALMCTFGLCLCRLDHQMSRRDQEKGAADCGDCHIHADASRCHRVLPSFQRARRSTQRAKRQVLRQLDERWMSAAGGRRKEKTFSSIELLASTSTESVG